MTCGNGFLSAFAAATTFELRMRRGAIAPNLGSSELELKPCNESTETELLHPPWCNKSRTAAFVISLNNSLPPSSNLHRSALSPALCHHHAYALTSFACTYMSERVFVTQRGRVCIVSSCHPLALVTQLHARLSRPFFRAGTRNYIYIFSHDKCSGKEETLNSGGQLLYKA